MISSLLNFHWIRPGWLLLIPIVAGLWGVWKRSSDPLRGWREQIDRDLLQAMTSRQSERSQIPDLCLLVAWLIAVVAIAGPTWKQEPNPFAADDAPLMVLLKADVSMDQIEPAPFAIQRAQLKIADLANIRQGQPLGLIAYAGSAHLVLPPTQDTSIVAEMASQVSPAIMPRPGDRLDLALQKANEILSEEKAGGTVLVIADSLSGNPETISQARKSSGSLSIQILALKDDPATSSAARALNASLVELTPDDQDIETIVRTAKRNAFVGMTGEGTRWQEAGYWLVPLLALLSAASFRRESCRPEDQQ